MRVDALLPDTIRTPDELRTVIRRCEVLSSILRMSGHPLACLPLRAEMSDAIELLTQFARKSFDPYFMREFHRATVRRAG